MGRSHYFGLIFISCRDRGILTLTVLCFSCVCWVSLSAEEVGLTVSESSERLRADYTPVGRVVSDSWFYLHGYDKIGTVICSSRKSQVCFIRR